MGRIVIDWDRESGKADYRIEEMSHVEAQRILIAVTGDCVERALMEIRGHEHTHHRSSHGGRGWAQVFMEAEDGH